MQSVNVKGDKFLYVGSSVSLIEFVVSELSVVFFCCIVGKSVHANPGLKFNRIITFSSLQNFFCWFALCIW